LRRCRQRSGTRLPGGGIPKLGAVSGALQAFFMPVHLLALVLGGCAGVSFAPTLGFYGVWHGPRTIAFTGSNYEANGHTGHYGSDANALYFTPSLNPPGVQQPATISCPYTLMGGTLILRDCPYAGEYRR
jgi:hypothetical protein